MNEPLLSPNRPLICGLVSISDRASQGVYPDQGIPALEEWLGKTILGEIVCLTRLIADNQLEIQNTLIQLADIERCDLILTTGGTGPSRRDVTPEATKAVASKELPGFGEQMRQISLHFVPTAILSRQTAVVREHPSDAHHASLIVNLPGQPKSIVETLEGVRNTEGHITTPGIFAAIPYCLQLINGVYIETDEAFCKAFRPKNARRPQS